MNHVTLIGRITRNLDLRQTNSGKSYVFFSVAVSALNNKTDYINCVAWNRIAENMAKYVGKGSLIAVTGRLLTRKDNRDQFIMEVSANSVSFLERKKDILDENHKNYVTDSQTQKNKTEKTNEVNIDEVLQDTNYDTEISFVNNDSLNNSDSDDDAIIWD